MITHSPHRTGTTVSFVLRALSLAGALAGLALTVSAALSAMPSDGCPGKGAAKYRALDLGTLGGSHSVAEAVNEAGQIVGSSTTASGEWHAFLWDRAALWMREDASPARP